jgi:hypothetical protein
MRRINLHCESPRTFIPSLQQFAFFAVVEHMPRAILPIQYPYLNRGPGRPTLVFHCGRAVKDHPVYDMYDVIDHSLFPLWMQQRLKAWCLHMKASRCLPCGVTTMKLERKGYFIRRSLPYNHHKSEN